MRDSLLVREQCCCHAAYFTPLPAYLGQQPTNIRIPHLQAPDFAKVTSRPISWRKATYPENYTFKSIFRGVGGVSDCARSVIDSSVGLDIHIPAYGWSTAHGTRNWAKIVRHSAARSPPSQAWESSTSPRPRIGTSGGVSVIAVSSSQKPITRTTSYRARSPWYLTEAWLVFTTLPPGPGAVVILGTMHPCVTSILPIMHGMFLHLVEKFEAHLSRD